MPTHPYLAAPNPAPLRLELKPPVPAAGWVDGVWWPRSTDLTAELPMLLTAVAARISRVVLVGYHIHSWEPAPTHLDSATGIVVLQGFTFDAPQSVVLVGAGGLRLTLTVLTPQTTSTAAQVAFDQVSQPEEAPEEAPDDTDPRLEEVGMRLAAADGRRGADRAADIAQWVSDAAEQFADAPVQAYVPILVEHIVRQKLGPPQRARLTTDTKE